jgi:pyruvate,water dikinase
MSWLRRIVGTPSEAEGVRLVKLRSTRFRHLLRHYGKFLDLLADAAEKQAGDYVLDKQYIVSTAEILFDVADTVVFDLNVMTNQRCGSFYEIMDRIHTEVKKSLASWSDDSKRQEEAGTPLGQNGKSSVSIGSDRLVDAIARYPVLYRQRGQIACRGVAAGPVLNLCTEKNPERFPAGAVLVASEIKPEAELLRAMRNAAAILTDGGKPASHMASVAREFRIPSIVGLQDASKQLATGTLVTVDADENRVYLGRLQELLDYYREERLGSDEESEYILLRSLRRQVSQLTIGKGGGSPGDGIKDCKSLYDIIHLAQELAGEALVELVTGRRDVRRAGVGLNAGFAANLNAIFLSGVPAAVPPRGKLELRATDSLPLATFVAGVAAPHQELRPGTPPPSALEMIMAIVNDEHADIILQQPGGVDIVDAYLSESKESNYLYCRLISGAEEPDFAGDRGSIAGEILSRLDFATTRTNKAVTGWIGNLPRGELQERLLKVGRLAGYLKEMDAGGWRNVQVEERVENFMLHYA